MSLLNVQNVKKTVKSHCELRSKKFTQVSAEFITALEIHVEYLISESVRHHPSRGKTITELHAKR